MSRTYQSLRAKVPCDKCSPYGSRYLDLESLYLPPSHGGSTAAREKRARPRVSLYSSRIVGTVRDNDKTVTTARTRGNQMKARMEGVVLVILFISAIRDHSEARGAFPAGPER